MKLDNIVLIAVAAIAGLMAVGYLVALILGVVATRGLMLPALVVFLGVVAVFVTIVRQRLANREDDHYEKIEK